MANDLESVIVASVLDEARNGLSKAGDFAVAELQDWTSEWKKKPVFSKEVEDSGNTVLVTAVDPVRAGKRSRVNVLIYGARGPWTIKPKRAKVLSWVDNDTGERVFAKTVTHPGIKPHPIPMRIAKDLQSDKVLSFF